MKTMLVKGIIVVAGFMSLQQPALAETNSSAPKGANSEIDFSMPETYGPLYGIRYSRTKGYVKNTLLEELNEMGCSNVSVKYIGDSSYKYYVTFSVLSIPLGSVFLSDIILGWLPFYNAALYGVNRRGSFVGVATCETPLLIKGQVSHYTTSPFMSRNEIEIKAYDRSNGNLKHHIVK